MFWALFPLLGTGSEKLLKKGEQYITVTFLRFSFLHNPRVGTLVVLSSCQKYHCPYFTLSISEYFNNSWLTRKDERNSRYT